MTEARSRDKLAGGEWQRTVKASRLVMSVMRVETVTCAKRPLRAVGSDGGGAEPSGFWDGTAIAVPGGVRPVEDLREGDLLLTRDHGSQPVRQVIRYGGMGPDAVSVAAGALGNPATCLLAPGTNVLMAGWAVELYFGLDECLVPLGALCGAPGITSAQGAGGTLTSILLAQPDLLQAAGIDVESGALAPSDAADDRTLGRIDLPPVIDGAEARLLRPG